MLICIRRLLALTLIPLFILLFLGTLLTFRVNATLLEPEFYTDTLEKLDAYNFLYAEGIPTAIEEAEADGTFDLDEDVPLNLGLTPESVSGYISDVLPAEWLTENVAIVINAGVPYITGETDEFEITIALDDRVERATEVAKELILGADIHAFLLEDIVEEQLEQNAGEFLDDLPYGLALTNAQIIAGIERVVPEDWLKDQIAAVIDELTPYVIGRVETFTIVIPLDERAEVSLGVVEDWLLTSLDGGAYDYLLTDQIAPVVQDSLGSAVELPYGVTLTNAEIVEALGKVLPRSWVEERVRELIGTVGPYLTAQSDDFTLVIPLEDRTQLAAETLVDLADRKFEAVYTSLRTCTGPELLTLQITRDALPDCRPPIITYEQFKGLAGLDVEQEIQQAVVQQLPQTIQLSPDDVFGAIGESSPVSIDDIREILSEGFTFTEKDLTELIQEQAGTVDDGLDNVELMSDIRGYLRDGFTFDQSDIEEQFASQSDFDTFNDVRGYIDLGRSVLFVLIVLLGFIALFIGILGGRRFGTRLVWAGIPVLIAGGATAIILGPVSGIGFEVLDDFINEVDASEVFVAKLIELRVVLEDSFVSPMAFQSTVVGGFGLAMIVFGSIVGRRGRHRVRAIPTPTNAWETAETHQTREVVEELRSEVEELHNEIDDLQDEADGARGGDRP